MEDIISKLVKQHKTNCPFTIARNLNISIYFEDLGQGTRGFYYKKLRRRFICIHRDLSEEWKRFVCAHELGHDRLHKGMSRFFIDERSFFSPGKYERQANEFAVLLLLSGADINQEDTLTNLLSKTGIPYEMIDYVKRKAVMTNG